MEVSVVIQIYNAERYMRRAVESALAQPETAEVLLVEDASPDNALKICRELENEFKRVRLLRHPDHGNHGAGASRNLGILNAKSLYIAFLDADDFFLENRFAHTKVLFEKFSDVDGVYEAVGFEFLTEAGRQKWLAKGFHHNGHMVDCAKPDNLFETLVNGKGTIHLNGLTVKKSLFEKCGYFPESLKVHQDTALIVKMSVWGKLVPGHLSKPVAMRTFHDENRILNQKDKHLDKYLYWKMLFNWACDNSLSSNRLTFLFNRYLYSVLRSLKSQNLEFNNYCQRIISFSKDILSHPFLFIVAVSQAIYERVLHKSFNSSLFGRGAR